ncbi:MAG: S9 family peptidase, partial [Balneolaceae bacterium]
MRLVKYLVVIMAVMSTVAVAQEKKPIEFEHLFDGTFSPNSVQNVRWMNDGQYYTATEENAIVRYNIVDGSRSVLFEGSSHSVSGHEDGIKI